MSDLMNATLLGTPGVVGVYNHTIPCDSFRNDTSRLLFKIWPESSFKFCCEDSNPHPYSLQNFTYGEHGTRLISRPYFDLGKVDDLSPYWMQYKFWQVPRTQIVLVGLKCEYTDLAQLYSHRFWNRVVKDGAITAQWVILLLQFIVVVFVVFKWVWFLWKNRNKQGRWALMKEHFSADMKRWWWTKIKLEDWVSDLTHLGMLVAVGFSLIEAVGHSSPTQWRPILFYNAAVVYNYLTALSLISSVLRQLAVCFSDESDEEAKPRGQVQTTNVGLSRISEDWLWQRVFGQLAVLVLVGTYLRFVDDVLGTAMDSVAAIVFATMVVACTWSGGVGLVVAGRIVAQFVAHMARIRRRLELRRRMRRLWLWFRSSCMHQSQEDRQRHPPGVYSLNMIMNILKTFFSRGGKPQCSNGIPPGVMPCHSPCEFNHLICGISEETGSEGFRRLPEL